MTYNIANVVSTGSSTARSLSTRFADVFDVKDYGAKLDGTTDDTAAFQATATAIVASTYGGTFFIPSGDTVLSAQITAAIGGNQRFIIKSDGQHSARLHWTSSSSAGFAITLNAITSAFWISNGPTVSVENITNLSNWSTTTSQTAISITAQPGDNSTTFERPIPPAIYVNNVSTVSKTNSGGFAGLLSLTNVATCKVENLSLWGSSGDTTATLLTVTASVVTTGIRVNGLRQQRGGTAVVVTDNIQGIYITDMQTVGTQNSISWTNPGGYAGAGSLIVDHSQFNSVLSEINITNVGQVQLIGNYFLGNTVGWYGANITGNSVHVISNNIFLTTQASDATASGLILNNVNYAAVNGNNFYGIIGADASGAPVQLLGTTIGAIVSGNTSANSTIGYNGSSVPLNNTFADNILGGKLVPYGAIAATNVGVFGPMYEANANSVNASASATAVIGQAHVISSTATNAMAVGFNNTLSASASSVFGNVSKVTAANSMVVGKRGSCPYIGCVVQANSGNQVGGAQQMFWTWQFKTTSTTPARATADGTATYSNFNTFGLSSLGATNTMAVFQINIAMVDGTTPANSGSWYLPIGHLIYPNLAASTTWTQGTPVALGTAFTVSITADTTNSGLNITITPPSTDALIFTISFRATIATAY